MVHETGPFCSNKGLNELLLIWKSNHNVIQSVISLEFQGQIRNMDTWFEVAISFHWTHKVAQPFNTQRSGLYKFLFRFSFSIHSPHGHFCIQGTV